MDINNLRQKIKEFLSVEDVLRPDKIKILDELEEKTYVRKLIAYQGSEGDRIKAYLYIPKGTGPFPGILLHHQHNGEWHLGKSEVCGLAGDPYQFFGPELAKNKFAVLAPDSICFEDRRRNASGTEFTDVDSDWTQHYNEMAYRLVRGELLMKKVLDDANIAVSILEEQSLVDNSKLGVLGHSYGGQTVLFQGALDERIKFACSSGAASSYKNKMEEGTGIERAAVIPGFINKFEIVDIVKCFVPRKLLIVSATKDKYTADATEIYNEALKYFEKFGVSDKLIHKRFEGGHGLNKKRFNYIIDWVVSQK